MEASPWVARFAALVPAAGAVLDVASGGGRHARLFLAAGHPVTAVDLDLGRLRALGPAPRLSLVCADLEGGAWPFAAGRFAGVVVTNFLWRPLFGHLAGAVAPGGVLLYETFARGHERFGKPRHPDHLLRPDELFEVFAPRLTVVAFEQGEVSTPRPAVVQRICAVCAPAGRLP